MLLPPSSPATETAAAQPHAGVSRNDMGIEIPRSKADDAVSSSDASVHKEVLKVTPSTRAPTPSLPVSDAEPYPAPEFGKVLGSTPMASGVLAGIVTTPKLDLEPLPVSQGVTPGRLIHKVEPVYPVGALVSRRQGTVVLKVSIQKTGRVGQVRVLSGDGILAQAAEDAVRQWVYEPFRLNNEPVDIEAEVTVNFKR